MAKKVGRRPKGLTIRSALMTVKMEPIVKEVIKRKFGSLAKFVDHYAYQLEELKEMDPRKVHRERRLNEIEKERAHIEEELSEIVE